MQIEIEKLIPAAVAFLALIFSVFSFWRTRKEARLKTSIDDAIELEKAHLTDSANFRAELREELKRLRDELEKALDKLEKRKAEIEDLQADVDDLIRKNKELESENKKLKNRIIELESQVERAKI
jgi:peptidoglycan hydrolase CwlO-like protein